MILIHPLRILVVELLLLVVTAAIIVRFIAAVSKVLPVLPSPVLVGVALLVSLLLIPLVRRRGRKWRLDIVTRRLWNSVERVVV